MKKSNLLQTHNWAAGLFQNKNRDLVGIIVMVIHQVWNVWLEAPRTAHLLTSTNSSNILREFEKALMATPSTDDSFSNSNSNCSSNNNERVSYNIENKRVDKAKNKKTTLKNKLEDTSKYVRWGITKRKRWKMKDEDSTSTSTKSL
jgi:hypothetical protein